MKASRYKISCVNIMCIFFLYMYYVSDLELQTDKKTTQTDRLTDRQTERQNDMIKANFQLKTSKFWKLQQKERRAKNRKGKSRRLKLRKVKKTENRKDKKITER